MANDVEVVAKPEVAEPVPVVVVSTRHDLTRTIFAVLFMAGLIGACFWILRPFIPALIWAAMVVVATWPLMLRTQAGLWNRRWLAVSVMTTAMLLAFVIPFTLAITTLVANADEISSWVRSISKAQLPALPQWVQNLPLAGPKIAAAWSELATYGPEELTARLEPYARGMMSWFVLEVGSFGILALQLIMTLIIAAILYAQGESAAAGVRHFFRRLSGARGEEVVELAGQAIRGVALGVVVTALVQSVLGGVGLAVAGVPFAGLLTAVMFVLAVAQIGAAPVIFAAAAWLYWQDETGWAIGLGIWAIFVGSMDNVLRPFLIQRGANLPLLLVFAGVIGGLVSFGLVGIFVGPLVLAVGYRLVEAWVREGGAPHA
ncbi:MAG TPA: AI-2E family transporter YdiK [Burkholderiales bacterium]|nr:AI-2E family transporter YdiK [Burkholderiales bacterium]